MNLYYLIDKNQIQAEQINLSALPSGFRKATMNMALTTLVCESAFAAIPLIAKENVAVIVATHFGEVLSTSVPKPGISMVNTVASASIDFNLFSKISLKDPQ